MALTINGTDPRSLSLSISEVTGWLEDAVRRYAAASVEGRDGQLVLDGTPDVSSVRMVIRGVVVGSSAADARAKLDSLKWLFAGPSLAVRFTDQAGRLKTALCERFAVATGAAQMISRHLSVEIELVAHDPYTYDEADTTVGYTGGDTSLPQGTGPVRPVITITGASTNPIITLKKSDGTTYATLALTITTIAGDSLVIDCAKRIIRLNGVNRLDALSGGDFLLIDEAVIGNYLLSAYPTYAVSGVTGSTSVTYRKAWR